jgi:aerobic carbon-monoxide dehydrogenase large subunit
VGIFGTGQAIRRSEDQRFLTGRGRFTDDITLARQAYLHLFRSPYPHGVITQLDVTKAKAANGVICVLTAEDLDDAGVHDLPGSDFPASSVSPAMAAIRQPALARGRVLYVGEPVAGIIAESITAAREAAELIEFEVDELDAIVSYRDSLRESATQLHDSAPGNSLGTLEHGDKDATEAVFASAAHVVEIELINNRIAPTPMESRACNASYAKATGELTLHQGCQGVHMLRGMIRQSFDIDEDKVHVFSPDVGGAFGLKTFLQCETVVAIAASMQLGRPVKWTAERSESFLSDLHGRDQVALASMALDPDGRFLAMRTHIDSNVGAYCSQFGPLIAWFGASMNTGCYDVAVVYVTVQAILTNTVPTDAYRGAGRPEATYVVERLVDKAAKKLGMAPDQIRHLNFIRADQFPYKTATDRIYDSGDYARLMDSALSRAEWSSFEERRKNTKAAGKLRGIGLSYYVEICASAGDEVSHVRFEENGRVTLLVGTQASGQGHETSYAQMVADGLGIEFDLVDVVQGDSDRIPSGGGTGGSRSMVMAGSSLYRSVNSVIRTGKLMAAEMLEAAAADIEFDAGSYRIAGTDRSTTINEVAAASFDDNRRPESVEAGLYGSEQFTIENGTFPNGCHICELVIDPETGQLEILRYTIEDDVGTVVNPLILEGQIVGGVAQGLGQACGEHAIYEQESGQLLTATFLDYAMPRADWIPDVQFAYREIPSPTNPLGIKGAGEAGTVGAAPALVNAVLDALAPTGIDHIDMPVTPVKIWKLLQST